MKRKLQIIFGILCFLVVAATPFLADMLAHYGFPEYLLVTNSNGGVEVRTSYAFSMILLDVGMVLAGIFTLAGDDL